MVDVTSDRIAAPVVVVTRHQYAAFAAMIVLFLIAPFFIYPIYLMNALCFSLFACAFNLLVGYAGLLSFGHAMFLGSAGYLSAHASRGWGVAPALALFFGGLGSPCARVSR